jgi:hypothetical protein
LFDRLNVGKGKKLQGTSYFLATNNQSPAPGYPEVIHAIRSAGSLIEAQIQLL